MESDRFDTFSRSLASLGTRRGVVRVLGTLPVLGALAARFGADSGARDRRKRAKAHHLDPQKRGSKHRPKSRKRKRQPQCVPATTAQTCAGKCATVTNNCGQAVNCGPCVCGVCPACTICNPATGQCVPNLLLDDQACGTSGQICQDGVCACDATSCSDGQYCDGTECACNSTSCADGCCADTICHRDDEAACGTNGGMCTPCGGGETCCGGTCVNALTDPDHCGTCPTVCGGETPDCVNGACVCNATSCTGGNICCAGTCQACAAQQVCGTLLGGNQACCYPSSTSGVCNASNEIFVCCAGSCCGGNLVVGCHYPTGTCQAPAL